MVNRRRLENWRRQELNLLAHAYAASGNVKLFESLADQATKIMAMMLHLPGAYVLEDKPVPETQGPSDLELLEMLDNLPEA